MSRHPSQWIAPTDHFDGNNLFRLIVRAANQTEKSRHDSRFPHDTKTACSKFFKKSVGATWIRKSVWAPRFASPGR